MQMTLDKNGGKKRYALLDSIRGIVLISMILYHGAWNMVYLYGRDWEWYLGQGVHIWQQSICWTFILLSGFCWPLGRKQGKRGLLVFGSGLLITAVTLLVMPANRIIFGVLTCIGSCMLLTVPLNRVLKKIPPQTGILLFFVLFLLTKNINYGFLGWQEGPCLTLPHWLYRDYFTAYLGFMPTDFFSTDYFSLIPWFFLFLTGYFLCLFFREKQLFDLPLMELNLPPLSFLGKHSLLIYLLHQPVLFLLGSLLIR
jgi:uncharacterized membrane protein